MTGVFRGQRPDLTPAQVTAALVAGVPIIATLLTAFGLAELDARQQAALTDALAWGGVLAGLLIGGDATLRTARNLADARQGSAAMLAGQAMAPPVAHPADPEVDRIEAAIAVHEGPLLEEPAARRDG